MPYLLPDQIEKGRIRPVISLQSFCLDRFKKASYVHTPGTFLEHMGATPNDCGSLWQSQVRLSERSFQGEVHGPDSAHYSLPRHGIVRLFP